MPVFVIKAPIAGHSLSWQLTTNGSVGKVITCGQLEKASVRVHVCVCTCVCARAHALALMDADPPSAGGWGEAGVSDLVGFCTHSRPLAALFIFLEFEVPLPAWEAC